MVCLFGLGLRRVFDAPRFTHLVQAEEGSSASPDRQQWSTGSKHSFVSDGTAKFVLRKRTGVVLHDRSLYASKVVFLTVLLRAAACSRALWQASWMVGVVVLKVRKHET